MAVQAQHTAIRMYGLRAEVLERIAPQPTTPVVCSTPGVDATVWMPTSAMSVYFVVSASSSR